ncbi:MAG: DUF2075 domain-containing protein [Desulfobacterales bacterium]
MRLYAGSSQQFIQDTVTNQIAEKLKSSFFTQFRYEPSPAEIRSWRNSLRAMCHTIEYADLLDHGIILEYQLPLSSNRLDCMVCGHDSDEQPNAVIVELKQWDGCSDADGKNEVLTWIGGAQREVLHPSVQVGKYKMYLEDMHPAFYEPPDKIKLNACSYLHNYHYEINDTIYDDKFSEALKHCPTFSADDFDALTSFLQSHLEAGNGYDIMKRAEENRYRPSKKLMQHVGNVIKGKREYILLDEQLIVYDKVLSIAQKGFHDRKKAVLIVKGGPGTGKSVIAINLMADLLLNDYNAHYATGSRAFTTTLREAIGRRGAPQFKYFNSFIGAENNLIDVLICDESHRIRDYSWSRFTPIEKRSNVHQIEELINVAKVSVFLIDDKQVVRPNEVGSVSLIKKSAQEHKYEVHEYELDVQFRCAGSEAFVNWINNTLGLERTANVLWKQEENFDFRIFSDPFSLEDAIRQKVDKGHTGRITAGFCWSWSKELKPDRSLYDDVVIGEYRKPWNARPEATRLAPGIPKATLWAYDPNGINQIGCIYTAQGFEFDYVGVIFGNDLKYDFDQQKWIGFKENSFDSAVKRSRKRFVDLVKNTYRVLLSRGMKGCYVYFMDKDTERFIKSRIERALFKEAKDEVSAQEISKTYQPFRYLPIEKVRPFENSVPLYDLKAAASVFSEEQQIETVFHENSFINVQGCEWVELPEAFRPHRNLFVAQVVGESMNRRIPNGAWCLFKLFPIGTRQGKVVLVQHREIQDTDIGGHFTVKIYESEKKKQSDGSWRHTKITLRPDSTYPEYEPIILSVNQAEDLRVIAEIIAVLS